ncbi:hypothetical protein OTU49_006353 [Cherax quadricarinatus]|uniref:Mitochondrial splicing suppressor 51-like C-terminal domain-containing protein n=1 Tax=Cherax quadricarinatus TaxID=27406 RepID=A0AAW0X1M4_CHEQU
MAFELTEYPPKSFSDKYQKYLAPHGVLLAPTQVLKNKKLGTSAEDTLRKAFKITLKKLRKMRAACANCNKTEGEASLQASLERIVTNVFSTVLTIGHCPFWFPSLTSTLHQYNEIHIHLLGADEPEVGAVESGLMQVASRVLGRPIVVTLVAPDLAHHPQTFSWTPTRPHQVTSSVRAVTYSGLYHDFWRDHLATSDTHAQVSRPQVALAIHPGVHTDEMLVLWKPTLQLLAYEHVPLVMTTYNEAEFHTTLQKLETLQANVVHGDVNPLRSLHLKQTPYEPDHVWAANSYIIAIDNSRTS